MPRRVVERLVCYVVHTGVGSSHGCSYDRSATYDDWDALMADVKEALEADRQVMIEPCLMTVEQFKGQGREFPAGVNPLL